jgi:CubicO group peptidase (beta-lactamase class C family)
MKLVIAAILTILFTVMTEAQDSRLPSMRLIFRKEAAEAGIVGGSFAFIKNGVVISEEHYGFADAEKKYEADAHTIYHWASNTKPFTGIAIMQLRDRGLLKLDDPVTKYLPELRDVHNKFGSMDEITIRQLMTHSAGFRASTWPWDKGEPWEPFEPTEYSQLEAMFPFTEILFKPGSKFSYSNLGIIFLGRIIEKLTGDDYEVYIDKNILKPLGMHRSYFDSTPYHLLKDRSHSYYIREGKRTEGRFDVNTGVTVSNSGLNSPTSDMVKYLNFLAGVWLGSSSERERYDTVLKRSSLEEMWRSQLPATTDANGNAGFTTDIGLVYFIDRRDGRTFIGHGGDQNGFISYIEVEPASRQASMLVFNTDVAGGAVYSRLRRSLRSLF